ncbi:MAG: hypothetical protein VX589_16970 [Myxococcota bacterium]|nr:hypothetical protein [Myxococcota bacterium]
MAEVKDARGGFHEAYQKVIGLFLLLKISRVLPRDVRDWKSLTEGAIERVGVAIVRRCFCSLYDSPGLSKKRFEIWLTVGGQR